MRGSQLEMGSLLPRPAVSRKPEPATEFQPGAQPTADQFVETERGSAPTCHRFGRGSVWRKPEPAPEYQPRAQTTADQFVVSERGSDPMSVAVAHALRSGKTRSLREDKDVIQGLQRAGRRRIFVETCTQNGAKVAAELRAIRDDNYVFFYERDQPFYEFTNFFLRGFTAPGPSGTVVSWLTSEHYFQAHKFTRADLAEQVQRKRTPREAFEFARRPENFRFVKEDWGTARVGVMRDALRHKFTQNPDLKDKLLRTGSKVIVEHSPVDSFWGDGGDGSGENMLGKLLMELRDRARDAEGGRAAAQQLRERTYGRRVSRQ